MNVIDLAQLLSGALDERFNITNKPAVVQVVTCLETFNITHESYREVQNTRIIKDLQALRQNKTNDQLLAKRIKNILRKWKERLASTVPVIQTSQPNSPQNFSQGSSDTQFMTQQSQSPPNSSQQLIRSVNGPTSFTNLLPKINNINTQVPKIVVSPQPPRLHHQNGIIEPTSMLGKRKMDNSQDAGVLSVSGGDVDENSNHSRRKMMKKTISGPISSPLSLNPNNSSINHQNHHPIVQSSQPIPVPAVTVVPLRQQQQPEVPKKRGRKKGSKGIDSMLNGAIPDFQAEIQQKIALSAGKRNKTTMELQQMLESHQNTAMSWQNGDLDTCSLDRGSSYQPLEASYNNAHSNDSVRTKNKVKSEPIASEPANKTVAALQPATSSHSSTLRPLTVDDEIAKLRAQLPPIDYQAAELDSFDDYRTIDDDGDSIECTCTFREVITYADAEEEKSKTETHEVNVPPSVVIKNGDVKLNDDDDSDDEDETDDFCAVDDDYIKTPSPPPTRGSAVKSIFDPEYDANENLIEEMVTSRRKQQQLQQSGRNGAAAVKVIEVKIEKNAVKTSRIEPILMIPEPTPTQLEHPPIINYECDEDPMCQARAHFQRDAVTSDDVERLHNGFINGVNGYWNGIPEDKPEPDFAKDMENIDYAKHQLWKRVVPRYNFLTLDKIPKTFDDDSPFSLPLNKSTSSHEEPDIKPTIEADGSYSNFKQEHKRSDIEFREWHEVMNLRSFNDDVLTVLPYVVID